MKTVGKKLLSLALAAVLLISAVPFQASAAPTSLSCGHGTEVYDAKDETQHTIKCTTASCTVVLDEDHNFTYVNSSAKHEKVCECGATIEEDHTYVEDPTTAKAATCVDDGKEADKICACGAKQVGAKISATGLHSYVDVAGTAKAATCAEEGKTADQKCSVCDDVKPGTTIPATGVHTYAANTSDKCTVCGYTRPHVTIYFEVVDPYTKVKTTYTSDKFLRDQTLTSDMLLDAAQDLKIPNATQLHWKQPDGTNAAGMTVVPGITLTANIVTEKVNLHVWYKVGDRVFKFKDFELDKALYKNTPALNYLIGNVDAAFNAGVVQPMLGYEWKNSKWYDYYYQDQSLTDQSHLLDSDRSVIAVLTPVDTYKITFEVGEIGASEKPTLVKDGVKNMTGNVMTVTYNKSVGTLPSAKCDGYVFKGWYTAKNGGGVKFESNDVYKTAGDTILYGYWEQQVKVIVRAYVNSNTTTPVQLAMDGYSDGSTLTYNDVLARVKQNYSGFTMAGLFTANSWKQYKDSNNTKAGAEALTVVPGTDGTFAVYVHLKNATVVSGTTGSTTSTTTTKPSDSSNPKTGDGVMLYTAAGVMVVAAAALITIQALRKKKVI